MSTRTPSEKLSASLTHKAGEYLKQPPNQLLPTADTYEKLAIIETIIWFQRNCTEKKMSYIQSILRHLSFAQRQKFDILTFKIKESTFSIIIPVDILDIAEQCNYVNQLFGCNAYLWPS